MKLVFLDVDGVLNHSLSDWERGGHRTIDDGCVAVLAGIIERTGAKVVLSSVWRLNPGACLLLRSLLPGSSVVGATPSPLSFNDDRKEEILAWLAKVYPFTFGWAGDVIESIAVLDDDADADLGDGSFFQTEFEHGGLTHEIGARVIEHLEGTA